MFLYLLILTVAVLIEEMLGFGDGDLDLELKREDALMLDLNSGTDRGWRMVLNGEC